MKFCICAQTPWQDYMSKDPIITIQLKIKTSILKKFSKYVQ